MSGKALGWAREAVCSGGLAAKAVLLLMADYADGSHELFPSVATMSCELQASERTVQRAITSLIEDGLVTREFRATGKGKTTSSKYRLALGQTGLGEGSEPRQSDTPRGVTVTPSPPSECHPHPRHSDTIQVNPQSYPERADALSEARAQDVAEAFERVGAEWSRVAPDRFARPRAWAAWVEACGIAEPAVLMAAALRFLAESDDVRRGKCMGLDRWLGDQRWEGWLGAAAGKVERTPFAGPAEVRSGFVAAKGEAWTASWIDPAGWDGTARALVPASGYAFDRLRREPGLADVLAGLTITLVPRSSS